MVVLCFSSIPTQIEHESDLNFVIVVEAEATPTQPKKQTHIRKPWNHPKRKR